MLPSLSASSPQPQVEGRVDGRLLAGGADREMQVRRHSLLGTGRLADHGQDLTALYLVARLYTNGSDLGIQGSEGAVSRLNYVAELRIGSDAGDGAITHGDNRCGDWRREVDPLVKFVANRPGRPPIAVQDGGVGHRQPPDGGAGCGACRGRGGPCRLASRRCGRGRGRGDRLLRYRRLDERCGAIWWRRTLKRRPRPLDPGLHPLLPRLPDPGGRRPPAAAAADPGIRPGGLPGKVVVLVSDPLERSACPRRRLSRRHRHEPAYSNHYQ